MSNSPIKRNKSLVMLSKDHHYGLLASWKIRRGFDLKTAPKRIIDFIINFWETHLNAHFIAEEKAIFNTIKHALVEEALQQHAQLKLLLQLISKEGTIEQLANFADLLEQHIRFEERQVFKMLQQELPEEELNEIGKKLEELHHEVFEDNYKDQFWLVKDE